MPPSSSSDWDTAASRHLAGVEENLALADWLETTGRLDPTTIGWAITMLFYASLHAVRAYLAARHSVLVTAHEDMRRLLATHPELRRTRADYDLLKQESESARYYLNALFTWEDFAKLKVKAERIRGTWKPATEQALRARTDPATRA